LSLVAVLPILTLLIALLAAKMSALKAGALAFIVAVALSLFPFKIGLLGLSVSIAKGTALSLYVSLIIGAALFIYALADSVGSIDVISGALIRLVSDRFLLFLMMSWIFSSFLQGIAGFGVPVAITAPILVRLGFDPVLACSAVLLGHSWSISFGSMGSSLSALSLVTGIPSASLSWYFAIYGVLAMVATGIGVCLLYGGWGSVRKGSFYLVFVGMVVTLALFIAVRLEATSLLGLAAGLAGLAAFLAIARTRKPEGSPLLKEPAPLNLLEALLPYILVVVLSVAFQLSKTDISLISFVFPAYATGLDFTVKAARKFSEIRLLGHPAPVIFFSAFLSILYYRIKGKWKSSSLHSIAKYSIDRTIPGFVSLSFLISTATIMMGSGMTESMALGISSISGKAYTLFVPLVGMTGAFITGSNTNSNVIFGALQFSIANALGLSPLLMSGAQSIGGGIGCAIGPTQILLGSASVGLQGQEDQLYRNLVPKVLLIGLLLGILNTTLCLWGGLFF
jgi:lactate permease